MVEIKAGEFWMGRVQMFRPDEQGYFLRPRIDDLPAHLIHIDTFFIDKTEVTQDDYSKFVQAAKHRVPFHWKDGRIPEGQGQFPAYNVSWDDADAYCKWAGKRLPTEAEWEKAARGGAEALRYPWGKDIDSSHANYLTDPATKSGRGTRPTGTYPPNAYGLYDMCGNVWEWTSDWYSAEYYGLGEVRDPRGPASGTLRTVRGGSWVNHDVSMLRTAYRHQVPPDTYAHSVGFRVVCEP
jgi:sulfatase modifying factor 1